MPQVFGSVDEVADELRAMIASTRERADVFARAIAEYRPGRTVVIHGATYGITEVRQRLVEVQVRVAAMERVLAMLLAIDPEKRAALDAVEQRAQAAGRAFVAGQR